MRQMERTVDVLIVGGGSAGAVLAARLSEDPGRFVMLVEQGPDLSLESADSDILSAYVGHAYMDPRRTAVFRDVLAGGAHWNETASRPRLAYSQGHGLGGGSAVNGLGANRGSPADYDEWEELGAAGWRWDNVLPYFRKLERDLDFEGPLHGRDGPLPIRSAPVEWRSGFVRGAMTALAARGVEEKPDQNGIWEDGLFAQRVNLDERFRRAPTALAWLTPEVRRRDNLAIVADVAAKRILTEGTRAIGASLDFGGALREVRAHRTIIAAGAFGSPLLLMRSGIGPGSHLQSRGVPVVRHLAGVGRNLMDHPYAGISGYLPRASRMADGVHHIPAIWRFSSGLDGCPPGDMHMGFIGRAAWHAMGRRVGALAFWVNKSHSRGFLELAANPDDQPVIDLRLLSDERDRLRLKQAFHDAAGLAADMAAMGAMGAPGPARLSDRAKKYGARTARNAFLTSLAALAVDLSGPFAPRTFDLLTRDGPTLAELLSDDAALDRYLDESVTGVWHPSGTCRMGRADDPLAVAAPDGAVHGVEGLSVCDASLFPSIPCANLNVPVIMTAERIADLVRGRALT